jgi:hypothetical protein
VVVVVGRVFSTTVGDTVITTGDAEDTTEEFIFVAWTGAEDIAEDITLTGA